MTRPLCLLLQPIHPAGAARLEAAGLEVIAAADTDLPALAPLLARAEAIITPAYRRHHRSSRP